MTPKSENPSGAAGVSKNCGRCKQANPTAPADENQDAYEYFEGTGRMIHPDGREELITIRARFRRGQVPAWALAMAGEGGGDA